MKLDIVTPLVTKPTIYTTDTGTHPISHIQSIFTESALRWIQSSNLVFSYLIFVTPYYSHLQSSKI